MAQEPEENTAAWTTVHEWLRIFGAARMALHPAKLVLALAALILTFGWGALLDGVWASSGRGVPADALDTYAAHVPVEARPDRGAVEHGVAELWRARTLAAVRQGVYAALSFDLLGPGSLCESAGAICRATSWMVSEHLFFSLLFFGGALAIWSLLGAAICRIAAVQFAQDRKIGIGQAVRFARGKYVSGFLISPLLLIGLMFGIGLLMAVGGALFSIPGIGNLFALLFPLALAGGLAIAFLMVGGVGGGSFFWPTVAVEGSDGFDAISRSFSYFFGKPVKTLWYGLTALAWGGVCWWLFGQMLLLALSATHRCLSFGAGGFGSGWWGMRGSSGEEITKLDAVWTAPHLGDLYQWGNSAHMGGWEPVAAGIIAFCVLAAVGLAWAFLASFYFSGSTIIYFLLRRDVDATDFEDVYLDEIDEEEEAGAEPPPPPAPEGETPEKDTRGDADVSLPVVTPPPGDTDAESDARDA